MQVVLHVLALVATGMALYPFVLVDPGLADTYISQGFECQFDALHTGRAVQKGHSFIVNSTTADRAFSRPDRRMDTKRMYEVGSSGEHVVAAIEARSDWMTFFYRLTSKSANKISLMAVNIRADAGRMCLEIMIREGMVDVVIPLSVQSELNLTMYHSLKHIEQTLSTPIIMPDRHTIEMLSDKNNFTTWMHEHGYGDYVPRTFRNLESITYPSIVKHSGGEFGVGTSIVHNITALEAVISKLDPRNVVIQEAITGLYDLSLYFMARRGRLVATFCGIFPGASEIFVRGVTNAAPEMNTFKCTDMDAISPFFDVMQSIVRDAEYNGGGCFDLKVVKSNKDGTRSPFSVLNSITKLPRSSLQSIESDFTRRAPFPALNDNDDVSILPIIFELNNRICANFVTNPDVFHAMIRTYLASV